jgi:hypothetical protein
VAVPDLFLLLVAVAKASRMSLVEGMAGLVAARFAGAPAAA